MPEFLSHHHISYIKWFAKDTSKFRDTEALIFRILYLAFKDSVLIVMTAGNGSHCNEIS